MFISGKFRAAPVDPAKIQIHMIVFYIHLTGSHSAQVFS